MKILIVRFSSIGDIVLTSPVVRALKQQLQEVEIHYLTKQGFKSLVDPNPNISKVFTIEQSIDEVITDLKKEQYDWVIDLHNNIRTKGLKSKLRRPHKTFRKLNWEKWLLVNLKKNKLPDIHVVDRYFETVKHLGVKPDGKPGDFYIEPDNEVNPENHGLKAGNYITFAIGAQHETKCLPPFKIKEIIDKINVPVVLIGGPTDEDKVWDIADKGSEKIWNMCGKLNIQQSASIVKQSKRLITHDTGMMHIASCFELPMTTVWGNTVPDFGMYPYVPGNPSLFTIHQVENLSCRPCSKIGHKSCPKKHFKCMVEQDSEAIAKG